MVGFDASVQAIRKHRQANPAIVAKHQLTTDPIAIGDELELYTRRRLGIPDMQPTFFQPGRSRLPVGVVAAAVNIKRAAQGTAVVLDWLTSGGKPVAQELAESRAKICSECPKNVEGSWYTVAPAELIRETLESRSDLRLITKYDAKLKSCDVCKCLNRLKVWCPMEHIANRTNADIMKEFPSHCWIAKRQ